MLIVNTEEGTINNLVASGTPNEICGDVALIINEIWKGIAKPAREPFKFCITQLLVDPRTPMWDGTGPAHITEDAEQTEEVPNHEMQVYEAIVEKKSDAEIVDIIVDALADFTQLLSLQEMECKSRESERYFHTKQIKAKFREKLAALQIACDLMSVIVGDTAEEECKAIEELERRLQEPEE